jgi:hypothetical protein
MRGRLRAIWPQLSAPVVRGDVRFLRSARSGLDLGQGPVDIGGPAPATVGVGGQGVDLGGAGEVTFVADNQGGETHEFLVVEADAAEVLPVDEIGAFDEEAFGEDNVLGEVEDVASGTSEELALDLDAGTYVLLCNVVEEAEGGEVERHFAEGMHATITAE